MFEKIIVGQNLTYLMLDFKLLRRLFSKK